MRIFILEDDQRRIDTFRETLKREHSLYFVTDVKSAIDLHESDGPFDMYFLDHDLDGRVFVDSNEYNTGYQFAKYLITKDISNATIIVHSLNIEGGGKMVDIIPNAKRIPFINMYSFLIDI